jgi:hypothetical protein
MGRLSFDLASLIGLPYGVALEASEGKLTVVELQQKTEAVEIAAAAAVGEAGGAAAEHNRHLKMSDKGGEEKQKLTQEDIEALKEQGSKGVDIVGKVIENSATFKAKTVFSQVRERQPRFIRSLFFTPSLVGRLRQPPSLCHFQRGVLSFCPHLGTSLCLVHPGVHQYHHRHMHTSAHIHTPLYTKSHRLDIISTSHRRSTSRPRPRSTRTSSQCTDPRRDF